MTGQPISLPLSQRRNPVLAHHAEDYFVTFFLASTLRASVGQDSFFVTRGARFNDIVSLPSVMFINPFGSNSRLFDAL